MILDAVQLSGSGRPVLLEGEVERLMINKVDLVFPGEGGIEGAVAEKYKGGRIVLTSHRILWIDVAASPSPGLSCFVPLCAVHSGSISKSISAWVKTPKLKLQVLHNGNRRPATDIADAVGTVKLALLCNDGVPDTWEKQLNSALAKREWLNTSAAQSPQPTISTTAPLPSKLDSSGANIQMVEQLVGMGFNRNRSIRALVATNNENLSAAMDWILAFQHDPSLDNPLGVADRTGAWGNPSSTPPLSLKSVGVAAIIKKQEEAAQQTDQSLTQAFQDLRGLMEKAQEMVKLAEKFRSSLGSSGMDSDALDEETMSEMIRMGIASPVTKETAGALYHQELSRQLADFITEPLAKAGGMMTLPDVYCRFNRARGAELVSPEDLMQAASLFPKIGMPLQVKSFPSGVTVIQSSAHDESEVCRKISEVVENGKKEVGGLGRPITASDIATALSVPVTIAQEHLLTAENRGVLCRDDGLEGLRFFDNFFKSAHVM
ncbi:hypothetical protein BSKO_06064 [Bryopsis sp. KO-2023]|nr:hypothetical protein BSKO_06064 [Bryopsis sp. KO-2023]